MRDRHRSLEQLHRRLRRQADRRLARAEISPEQASRYGGAVPGRLAAFWDEVESRFTAPEKPDGVEAFLHELWGPSPL
jgi:hypothetical protein